MNEDKLNYINMHSLYLGYHMMKEWKADWLYAKYRIKTEWGSGKRVKELKINCKKGIYVHDFDNSYVRFVRQRNGNWKLTFFGFGFDESKNPQLEGTYKFLCK